MADPFKNLVDMFEKSVKKHASQELFGTKRGGAWQWSTYQEIGDKVTALRGGLAAIGIKKGDCVAVVSNNREEWAILAYACYGLGAALVPMYEAQNPKEWAFIANDCSAVALVAGSGKVLETAKKLPEKVPSLKHVIGMELPKDDPDSFASLIEKGKSSPVDALDPEPKDTACLIYTSGTTGNPKGVILSHGNIVSNVNAVQHMLPIGVDDRSLSFLPWAHSFGHTCELHVMISRGASIALAEAVDKIVSNLAEVHPTLLFSVPRIFNRIYDGVNKQMTEKPAIIKSLFATGIRAATKKRKGESLTFGESIALPLARKIIFTKIVDKFGGRLKYAFSGGAALSREVAEFIDGLGITVYEGYGLTETSPIATANRPGAHKIGSVGKPIEDVKIVIDKTQTAPDAKDGEIVIYGPNIMQGYFNRDEENKAVFTEDRGFRTGDLGFVDDEGFLYITGRLKELYKLQNGKYVAPAPLEEKLKLSPLIANCMVYGDNQLFNVALVVPDFANLKDWAKEQGIDASSDAKLIEEPKVKEKLQAEVDHFAAEFKGFEEIKKVGLLPEDFTTENGMMTPSMKVKRRVVVERYKDKIDSLYAGAK
ncbi:MAG: long-chain fatty acid--CoA ligase [Myxococcales bacterium]|nr:long-chain fatty acid--CoA ligase [Myxococcales bacterium]